MLELLVAMTIGVVLMGIAMLSITTFLQTGYNGVASGQANDRAALALTLIRRQVVNADVIYNPATEGSNAGPTVPAGFSLRMLTAGARTTAPRATSLATATVPTCVQWRLLATGTLEDRSWPTGHTTPESVRSWRTVATGITNPTVRAPFTLDPTGAYGHRVLKIQFVLPDTTKSTGTTISITTSVTALDAQFFAPTAAQFCSPVPAP